MKLSLQWLSKYIPVEKTPEEIAEALTLLGFEVEHIEAFGYQPIDHVVVGQILSREQHPDADRLGVCTVNVGGEEPLQIVCGATNYKVNDKVPVAMIGAVLPGDFEIKQSKLRGVDSAGMMCSPKELGLGADHGGLMILGADAPIGKPLDTLLPPADTILEVELTPNRPDCLSHVGIARDLAAYWNLPFNPQYAEEAIPELPKESSILQKVEVIDPARCPVYRAYALQNVQIAPSPAWLQRDLEAIGLRPINNVVDITNYVLHEYGQPMHAFDADKLAGGKIIVRPAKEGEKINTLDGQKVTFSEDTLVITDAEKPQAIAGIMGGADSEVDDNTKNIVLEIAYFEPKTIRYHGRKLGISTDSSYRFERGTNPHGIEEAAKKALSLLQELAQATLVSQQIVTGDLPPATWNIRTTPDYIRNFCGFGPDDATIKSLLESLTLTVEESGDDWLVHIPSHRADLQRPVDLVEEFLRLYGTPNIPSSAGKFSSAAQEHSPLDFFEKNARGQLVAQQFQECYNYSLIHSQSAEAWSAVGAIDPHAVVANPLANDQDCLRNTLLSGLVQNFLHNQANDNHPRRLFEVGRVFHSFDGNLHECLSVAFLEIQQDTQDHWTAPVAPDFFSIKTVCQQLAHLAGVDTRKLAWATLDAPAWQATHAAFAAQEKQGYRIHTGLLNPHFTRKLGTTSLLWAGELILLPRLLERKAKLPTYQPFSTQPATHRDLALLVPRAESAETVRLQVERISGKASNKGFALENVRIFDQYSGQGLPEDQKSLAFSLTFRAGDRTLKDKEVNTVFENILTAIEEKTAYTVRK